MDERPSWGYLAEVEDKLHTRIVELQTERDGLRQQLSATRCDRLAWVDECSKLERRLATTGKLCDDLAERLYGDSLDTGTGA